MGMVWNEVFFENTLPEMEAVVNKLREITGLEIHFLPAVKHAEDDLEGGEISSVSPYQNFGLMYMDECDDKHIVLWTTNFGAGYLLGTTKFVLASLGGKLKQPSNPLPEWAGLSWEQAKGYFNRKPEQPNAWTTSTTPS